MKLKKVHLSQDYLPAGQIRLFAVIFHGDLSDFDEKVISREKITPINLFFFSPSQNKVWLNLLILFSLIDVYCK